MLRRVGRARDEQGFDAATFELLELRVGRDLAAADAEVGMAMRDDQDARFARFAHLCIFSICAAQRVWCSQQL